MNRLNKCMSLVLLWIFLSPINGVEAEDLKLENLTGIMAYESLANSPEKWWNAQPTLGVSYAYELSLSLNEVK